MLGKDNCNIGSSRRSFISKASSTLAMPFVLSGTVVGEQQKDDITKFKRLIERGQKIERKMGVEAKDQFLKNNGVPVSTVSTEYQMINQETDLETLGFDCVTGRDCDADLRLNLSISRSRTSFVYNVQLSFQHRYEKDGNYLVGGEDPKDACGFTWKGEELQVYDDSNIDETMSTTEYVSWNDGSFHDGDVYTSGQIGFEINDREWSENQPDTGYDENWYGKRDYKSEWSDTQSANVYLMSDSKADLSSEVHALYEHTWGANDVEISSIGLSYPWGISVGFSGGEPKSESTQTEANGSSLLKRSISDTNITCC